MHSEIIVFAQMTFLMSENLYVILQIQQYSRYNVSNLPGRTRTKDKYRVVYSDHQRLELEKEFHYSRYITIRRKSELAQGLNLSERQVRKGANWVALSDVCLCN